MFFKMKRVFSIWLVLSFLLVACGEKDDPVSTDRNEHETGSAASIAATELDDISSEDAEEEPTDQAGTIEFISSLKELHGEASTREFETMNGADWIEFPDDVYGFVNAITLDLNHDEKEEIIVLRSERDRGFIVDVYTAMEYGYEQTASECVAGFNGACAETIAIYQSPVIDGYGIVFDWEVSGTYARSVGLGAGIYRLTVDSITLIDQMEWNNVVGIPGGEQAVEEGMRNLGVPRAENAAVYDDNSDHSNLHHPRKGDTSGGGCRGLYGYAWLSPDRRSLGGINASEDPESAMESREKWGARGRFAGCIHIGRKLKIGEFKDFSCVCILDRGKWIIK